VSSLIIHRAGVFLLDCPAAHHLAVYCAASSGCRPVWYRPRC